MANITQTDRPEGDNGIPGLLMAWSLSQLTLTSIGATFVAGDLRAFSRQDWVVAIQGTGLVVQGNQITGGTITAIQQTTRSGERFYIDGLSLPGETWAGYVASGNEAGLVATILAGDDAIIATELPDTIHGYGGADVIQGRGDSDTIDAGAGNDLVYAGWGADTVLGGDGDDTVYGEAGADWLQGQDGNDTLAGGVENDTLQGGAGNDILYGEAGEDMLFGQDGNDQLFGGVENDRLSGDAGDDQLSGDAGEDLLSGQDGNDQLFGGVENDQLSGDAGDDRLFGDSGDDLLQGGAGNDFLFGDVGIDRLYGGDGDDILNGGNDNDLLYGGAGNDYLDGGENLDLLYGGAGDDVLVGGGSFDTAGFDLLRRQLTGLSGDNAERIATSPEGTDVLRSIEALQFIDGRLELDGGGTGAAVYRLYAAGLGRGADTIGLGEWVERIDHGGSLNEVAQQIVGSGEFAARFGNPSNAGFVTLLYQLSLGRDPDQAGLDYWTGVLDTGTPRGDLLAAFAGTPEHIDRVGQPDANGLWIAKPEAVETVRYYQAVYDRLPDIGGLTYWTGALEAGLTLRDMGTAFAGAPEFQATYGNLSNSGFVALLYENALGRPADAAGLGYWTGLLDSGAQGRSQVVEGFAFSNEMTLLILPRVDDGITFA